MRRSLLGSTGILVSCVGLGTVKFGRNQGVRYPEKFALPSDKAIVDLLACAQELGINLLDTAPAYGNSEERLGHLLLHQRHQWVICTKVGEEFVDGQSHFDFSPQAIRKSIERSLKRLHTDFLDIVLVHSNGEDKELIENQAVFVTLSQLKQEGLLRAFGMSTKTIAGGFLAVDQADVVMVTYNPQHIEEQSVIQHACKSNKGLFIKKALMSGHLPVLESNQDPILNTMQFIFKEPGVSSVILGTLNKQHLIHNIQCVSAALSKEKFK